MQDDVVVAFILIMSVLLHQLVADAVNHLVVIIRLIALLIDERIACRIIEHHDVVELHVAQTLYAAVIPVRPLYVALHWQWWKDEEGPIRFIMSWVDALVFALVAVYFINLFFFQNYVIPSSSLEKSLLTGDYLFVSKVSYGPRIPETPLTMPASTSPGTT